MSPTEMTDCRRCQQIRSGTSPIPYCRIHQPELWAEWRQVTPDTRCLHCSHDDSASPHWCHHCDHEGHGRQNNPENCVHCALYWIDAPLPHRRIAREEAL